MDDQFNFSRVNPSSCRSAWHSAISRIAISEMLTPAAHLPLLAEMHVTWHGHETIVSNKGQVGATQVLPGAVYSWWQNRCLLKIHKTKSEGGDQWLPMGNASDSVFRFGRDANCLSLGCVWAAWLQTCQAWKVKPLSDGHVSNACRLHVFGHRPWQGWSRSHQVAEDLLAVAWWPSRG